MADKKYLIDNAELMTEWDWDKNTDLDPYTLTMGSNKKYGGNVPRVTNGKLQSIAEITEMDVHIVQADLLL